MRNLLFLVLFAGCGGDGAAQCDANQYCSSGAHYNFCNGGGSDGCYYSASDGSRFACRSCGDCANALFAAQSWCEQSPPDNNNISSNGTCGGDTLCSSGSYRLCTDAGGCYYLVSGGARIDCNSCSDCLSAVQQVSSWCDPNANDGVCANDQSGCTTCCQQHHTAGGQKALDLGKSCLCNGCPACATYTVCGGTSSTLSNDCSSCISSAATKSCLADAQQKCTADPACNAYYQCAVAECNVM